MRVWWAQGSSHILHSMALKGPRSKHKIWINMIDINGFWWFLIHCFRPFRSFSCFFDNFLRNLRAMFDINSQLSSWKSSPHTLYKIRSPQKSSPDIPSIPLWHLLLTSRHLLPVGQNHRCLLVKSCQVISEGEQVLNLITFSCQKQSFFWDCYFLNSSKSNTNVLNTRGVVVDWIPANKQTESASCIFGDLTFLLWEELLPKLLDKKSIVLTQDPMGLKLMPPVVLEQWGFDHP